MIETLCYSTLYTQMSKEVQLHCLVDDNVSCSKRKAWSVYSRYDEHWKKEKHRFPLDVLSLSAVHDNRPTIERSEAVKTAIVGVSMDDLSRGFPSPLQYKTRRRRI